MRKSPKYCTYCPATSDDKDHVPPKSLFPKPRPTTLITVPSCRKCNAAFQLDDDYFWCRISTRLEGYGSAAQIDAATRAISRMNEPKAGGMRGSFVDDARVVSVGGIDRLAYEVDVERLNRTITRIIRALWFHTQLRRWTESYCTEVQDVDLIPMPERAPILAKARTLPNRARVGDVFEYRYALIQEDPNSSLWLLSFYGTSHFMARAGPQGS